jgi:hypothetical protein
MNDTDRKYDYLKTLRWIFMIDNNLNVLFLMLFWLNHFKLVFWVYLVVIILQLIGEVVIIRRMETELEV